MKKKKGKTKKKKSWSKEGRDNKFKRRKNKKN